MVFTEIKRIMDSVSPLWGVCGFGCVEDNLIACRAISRLPEKPKSIIVACFPYLLPEKNYAKSNVSKYAVVTDYHDVASTRLERACGELKKLFPANSFVPFADNSPIPEVRAALAAGLGVLGKNSLLITEKYGSFVFLGEIVTDLELDAKETPPVHCIGCGRCVSRCPSQAIGENGIDSQKCLSAITQKKGSLTEKETELMINCGCVWGCDICQDICPMNKTAAATQIEEFLADPVPLLSAEMPLEGRAYAWRGRKVIERNLSIFNQGENK